MTEYEPVTGRSEFLKKWLKEGKPGTEFSINHVYQLALDVFASRRGEDWLNCDRFINDQEWLAHPDGRQIALSFDKSVNHPLSASVAFFPNAEAAYDYDYSKGYEFQRTSDGVVVVEEDSGTEVAQEVVLSQQACTRLYRDILQAHINTPFKR